MSNRQSQGDQQQPVNPNQGTFRPDEEADEKSAQQNPLGDTNEVVDTDTDADIDDDSDDALEEDDEEDGSGGHI